MGAHRIAVIGGDGIGPEVIEAGCRVLATLAEAQGGLAFDFRRFDWGSDYYRRTGRMMPEDGLAQLAEFDAIYFGAVGDPHLPDDVTLWGLRLAICQGFDQYANVRPSKLLPGIVGPLRPELGAGIDWVIVRENSEGEYAGVGGRAHRGLPIEVGMDVAVFTRAGVARIARYACDLARARPRKLLTIVTKSNAQRHGMVLWDEVCKEVIRDYPDLTVDWMLVDAMTQRMVNKPGSIDTVVATNLHADILTDLAAALSGSLGLGATANIDPSRQHPSMFEPIHGSAFDITGKGIANPLASFWTAAMMLDHLGEPRASQRLMSAIETVTARREVVPPDLGGKATTQQVTDAVIAAIRGANRETSRVAPDAGSDFEAWIDDELSDRGAFTALVVLVEIGERSVTPVVSTYITVSTEIDWPEVVTLFAGVGIPWDGASFFPVTAPESGPLDDAAARASLIEIERRVRAERLTLNEGFFFDHDGQRIMIEVGPQG